MPRITTTHKGEMLLESSLGNHRLLLDVPAAIGGRDRGPTPLQLLAASLSSCIAGTVLFYCNRNALDGRDLRVSVDYELASDPYRLVGFEVEIDLPHVDVTEREQTIARVARHCPVHETMAGMEEVTIRVMGTRGA